MKVTRTRKQPPQENKQERAAPFRTSEQVLSLLVFFMQVFVRGFLWTKIQ
ncbi:hypothetical protein D932_02195 [Enterococcus casseliflavus 14-MB-W-14]|nr:hypothetical protein D932_02195 [Enterococcus casseliflavus 14-MB-W-14]